MASNDEYEAQIIRLKANRDYWMEKAYCLRNWLWIGVIVFCLWGWRNAAYERDKLRTELDAVHEKILQAIEKTPKIFDLVAEVEA